MTNMKVLLTNWTISGAVIRPTDAVNCESVNCEQLSWQATSVENFNAIANALHSCLGQTRKAKTKQEFWDFCQAFQSGQTDDKPLFLPILEPESGRVALLIPGQNAIGFYLYEILRNIGLGLNPVSSTTELLAGTAAFKRDLENRRTKTAGTTNTSFN